MNATMKALLLKHVVCGYVVVGIRLMKTRDKQVRTIDILSLKEQALAIPLGIAPSTSMQFDTSARTLSSSVYERTSA
jgi:hypothetical protein